MKIVEFYLNKKGYNMAIVIPGKGLTPNPDNTPKTTPPPEGQ